MKVNLFFMYKSFGGGTTSYTAHLVRTLQSQGHEVTVYRVKPRGDGRARPFARYDGVTYHNVDIEVALKAVKKAPSLMTAPCNSRYLDPPDAIAQLMKAGMKIVIHDPNEFEIYDHLDNRESVLKPFCIRPAMKNFFKNAIFIPHPYVFEYAAAPKLEGRELSGVSVARVTFVKRTELILEANRDLKKDRRIVLRGAENRLYTRFKLCVKFPEFKQGTTGYPMTWGASARECARGVFAVDFTYFPDDGGGSQYSYMEAWDAGSVNVLHKDWLRYKGEMEDGYNCVAVESPDELVEVINDWHTKPAAKRKFKKIAAAGRVHLENEHDPRRIARLYAKELSR